MPSTTKSLRKRGQSGSENANLYDVIMTEIEGDLTNAKFKPELLEQKSEESDEEHVARLTHYQNALSACESTLNVVARSYGVRAKAEKEKRQVKKREIAKTREKVERSEELMDVEKLLDDSS